MGLQLHWLGGGVRLNIPGFQSKHNFIILIQINQLTKCNNFSISLLNVYLQLNMFRASSRPSSGAQQLQQQSLILPLELGDSSVVGRDRPVTGPTTTNSTAITKLQR
jgi:hypothetical protein